MNAKGKIIGLAALIACGLAIMLSHRSSRVTTTPPGQDAPIAPRVEASAASVEPTLPVEPVAESQAQPAPQVKSSPQKQAQNQVPVPTVKPDKEPLHDPEAREALALVGLDPEAEQYWLEAIYDTSLPDNEREDLMEDLNETGFADPKNITADDLPLIMSRLQIIDAVLGNADDFMTPHLLEAQKDLVNMYARVAPNQ